MGYFVVNKLAIVARVDFRSYHSNSQNLETHQTNLSLSPALRYYFLPLQKKVNAFMEVGYLHDKSKWSSNSGLDYVVKTRGYYFSGGPSIFLSKQIALECTFGYRHTASDDFSNSKISQFSSGLGLQVHF